MKYQRDKPLPPATAGYGDWLGWQVPHCRYDIEPAYPVGGQAHGNKSDHHGETVGHHDALRFEMPCHLEIPGR